MLDRSITTFFRLFALGGVAALLWVGVRTFQLASSVGVGRLRDFDLLLAVGRQIMWRLHVPESERVAWMSWAHEPHALWSGAAVVDFVGTSLTLHLALVAAAALLAAPLLAWAWGRLRGRVPARRNRSRNVAVALVGAALLLTVGSSLVAPSRGESPAARPHVLVVSVDTLRADHLGSYGYGRDTSPHLDRLAREGARFETAVSPSSWTLPTHVTLLTGLPPEAHGVNEPLGLRLDADVTTLPERLWAEGYETAAFVAGGYLGAEYGHLQGFDHYDDYSVPLLCREERANYRNCTTSAKLVGLASAWLEGWDTAGRERPLFVLLHLWDVHNDYLPPPPWDRRFGPDTEIDFTVGTIMDGDVDPAALGAEQRERLVALYDGEIRHTDAWIGRLLAELESLGILDDTIVVVTSDHGEELGERDYWGHHRSLYDESVRVPLLMRHPGTIEPGTVVREPVRLADVAPTLLSLLGIEGEGASVEDGEARDLTPLLAGEARDLTPLLAGAAAPGEAGAAFSELHGRMVAIRTERWKLIRDETDPQAAELYDLRADPGERRNVAALHPEVTQRLSRRIDAWQSRWSGAGGHSDALEQRDDQLEQLRALGYIE